MRRPTYINDSFYTSGSALHPGLGFSAVGSSVPTEVRAETDYVDRIGYKKASKLFNYKRVRFPREDILGSLIDWDWIAGLGNLKKMSPGDFTLSIGQPGADPGGGGAGSGAHPSDGGTRAEGAGSFVSRAERKDTGVS